MYLWQILSRNKTELIYRVFTAQSNSSSVGDWLRLITDDKEELGIKMTNQEIQGVTENMFKNFVKRRVEISQLEYLNTLKKKHSKSKYLECKEIKMAEYLKDQRFSTKKKQLLFKLRSKTLDVKQNFKNSKANPWCLSCGLFPETQGHILQCPELTQKLMYLKGKTSKLDENDIYRNIEKQLAITNIYSDILDIRERNNRHEISRHETLIT